jgi:dTDP-4-dehydrorhamnose 3,5-epimerase
MAFRFEATAIGGVLMVTTDRFPDDRGEFSETWRASVFLEAGLPPFVQDNRSRSVAGVLRGLHFQRPPHAQGKLVAAAAGRVLDVAVDLRRDSPTFGRWVAVELSPENGRMLYVPPGCAHGFFVLQGEAVVTYKQTAEYAPAAEAGLVWNDPTVRVAWPTDSPRLSPKDGQLPTFAELVPTLPLTAREWLGQELAGGH